MLPFSFLFPFLPQNVGKPSVVDLTLLFLPDPPAFPKSQTSQKTRRGQT